ncbi:uncharacterized protein LOC62_05G007086 [Vanrija pseudolonga]|uniref:Uncharacterized protein n=1 Tax=Vanrija pseudolonga TaxID=143232 RepID=A0AAF0YB72_9TREE|nr:hypothetical protein LOC62_05G007086 [Vanrija pseudolonga]
MDMDMDLGWCLACSKQTRDQKPYCSEACRLKDTQPPEPIVETLQITSPLPPKLLSLPSPNLSRQSSDRRRSSDKNKATPVLTPLLTPLHDVVPLPADEHPRARDRRAFSFPASSENNSDSALPFARKARAVNSNSRSIARSDAKFAKSTGTNTPAVESAFLSTSDSDNDQLRSPQSPPFAPLSAKKTTKTRRNNPRSPLASPLGLHPSPPVPMSRLTFTELDPGGNSRPSSSPSQQPTARPSLDGRRTSTSPVTRLASSSSRSREDIITWARAVDHDGTVGRRAGRRADPLAHLTPPSTEPLDRPMSSTPTAAGAFSTLGSMTLGPVVKAFRSVSLAVSPQPEEQPNTPQPLTPLPETPSALGLQSVPAPATLSIVDVVVATRPTEADTSFFANCPTPTLSTNSRLSEVQDPMYGTDFGETLETATDDFSVISSLGLAPLSPRAQPQSPLSPLQAQRRKSSLALRPIQSTASAIWSISSYLRSFAPFTAPFSLASTSQPVKEAVTSPVVETVPLAPPAATSPVPTAGRAESPETITVDPARELVRSVPMDIVVPPGSKAQLATRERQREREAIEFLGPRSRSRTRVQASRSPSVERAAAKNAAELPRVTQELPRLHHDRPKIHGRQPSYDADASEPEEERGRGRGRGRSRAPVEAVVVTSVAVTVDVTVTASATEPTESSSEERRGRRRDRVNESRDRSWSPTRGRERPSRTRGAPPPAPVIRA